MASLDAYLDRGQQERDNLSYLLEQDGVSVDVYRRPAQAGAVGLTAETSDFQRLRTITVRFDSYRSRSSRRSDDQVLDTPIALADDTDVRAGDLWRWTDVSNTTRWRRVVGVDRTQSTSSVVLEDVQR